MKFVKTLLALVMLTTLSCTTDDETNGDVSLTIDASGLSDGKLAQNNTASFTADVIVYNGDASSLSYRWSLTTGRGELSEGTNALPNPTITGNTIYCIGKTTGSEKIKVEVLDADGNLLTRSIMDFTIIPPTDVISRGCFDQPKIIYQVGSTYYVCNFDGQGRQSLAVRGGLSVAISPDGEWIAWNDDANEYPYGWDMWVQRCDGSEKTRIEGGTGEDFLPHFSPDSKTLYFLRPEPSQEKPLNAVRPLDIAAYELETGQFRFLTTIYQQDERVSDFTVSPVTGEIAFFRQSYEFFPDGSYLVTHKLSFLQPESGLIRDFATLPSGRYDYGLDWSPDGGDIIYSASSTAGRGIFRINITDGSQPLLVFADPSDQSLPPIQPHYYAGGDRIVWAGQENGQNNINFWSIDANGNDLQQVTDFSGNEFLQGILH